MNEAEVREHLIAMIMDKVGVNRDEVINCEDIERDLGCTGDDHFELMEAFAKEFKVDMGGYRWYFHTAEEGHNVGAAFHPSPDQRVEHIPISLDTLTAAAMAGNWTIEYPDHRIPTTRWDLRINLALGLCVLLWAVIALYKKC